MAVVRRGLAISPSGPRRWQRPEFPRTGSHAASLFDCRRARAAAIVRGIYHPGGEALPAGGDGCVQASNGKLARVVRRLAVKRRSPAT